jgi:hypothetical protein
MSTSTCKDYPIILLLSFLYTLLKRLNPYKGCISTAHMFLAWRKRITVRISQLAGLSIAGHIVTPSIETRTNTRWPVMWWFVRQWIMWRYLAWASSPPLLLQLTKIKGYYFPNIPHTKYCLKRTGNICFGSLSHKIQDPLLISVDSALISQFRTGAVVVLLITGK